MKSKYDNIFDIIMSFVFGIVLAHILTFLIKPTNVIKENNIDDQFQNKKILKF